MKIIENIILAGALLITSASQIATSGDPGMYYDEDPAVMAKMILHKSVIALDQMMDTPESFIPPSLIGQAEGIVIVPDAFKLALGVVGGQGARGLAMVRKGNGSWSNPFFISLGEGSIGLQFGAQKTDIVLLFKNRNDILALGRTEITIGSDIGVCAGPVSTGSSACTDIQFNSEIYSYCNSKGLFAGISFKGGVLAFNANVNESLYGREAKNTDFIIHEIETPFNDGIYDLAEAVSMYEN